jgi:nucleoid-associated protein YgaU
MADPRKAILKAEWNDGTTSSFEVMYNPTELSFEKSTQLAEINIPGIDAPLQQFVRGQSERLTLELFFDTTEDGMGAGAASVTTKTDTIYQLAKIESERHAPPIVSFLWNDRFPGDSLSSRFGGQRRNKFRGVVESVKQRFTLFSPEGVPLRATLTVALREYRTLDDQLKELNLASPDRTHSHVVQRGETLSAIAARYYHRPGLWRQIAEENDIEDPRRLEVGRILTVPSLDRSRP